MKDVREISKTAISRNISLETSRVDILFWNIQYNGSIRQTESKRTIDSQVLKRNLLSENDKLLECKTNASVNFSTLSWAMNQYTSEVKNKYICTCSSYCVRIIIMDKYVTEIYLAMMRAENIIERHRYVLDRSARDLHSYEVT